MTDLSPLLQPLGLPSFKQMTLDILGADMAAAAGSMITVRTDRDVDVTGFGRICARNAISTYVIPRNGDLPTIDVIASRDPALQEWSRGFCYLVDVMPGPASGGAGVVGGTWKVVIDTTDSDHVRLTDYQGGRVVPVSEVDWNAILDRLNNVSVDASNAAAAAAAAEDKAQHAEDIAEAAAALPDDSIAGFLNASGSATRTAADALYAAPPTAWTTNGLSASSSVIGWLDHSNSVTGCGIREFQGFVELAIGFKYTDPTVIAVSSGASPGNFADVTVGTITDPALRPPVDIDTFVIYSGAAAYIGRISAAGQIAITGGLFPGQNLTQGLNLRIRGIWPKKA